MYNVCLHWELFVHMCSVEDISILKEKHNTLAFMMILWLIPSLVSGELERIRVYKRCKKCHPKNYVALTVWKWEKWSNVGGYTTIGIDEEMKGCGTTPVKRNRITSAGQQITLVKPRPRDLWPYLSDQVSITVSISRYSSLAYNTEASQRVGVITCDASCLHGSLR